MAEVRRFFTAKDAKMTKNGVEKKRERHRRGFWGIQGRFTRDLGMA
jgi:hypothetical protein